MKGEMGGLFNNETAFCVNTGAGSTDMAAIPAVIAVGGQVNTRTAGLTAAAERQAFPATRRDGGRDNRRNIVHTGPVAAVLPSIAGVPAETTVYGIDLHIGTTGTAGCKT